MHKPLPMYPKARQYGVLVEQVGDDTMIYDTERKEAHSLNRSAALVWRHCDGTRSLQQLAALIGEQLGTAQGQALVTYALDRLASAHLLEGVPAEDTDFVSRRDMMRRMSAASAAAIAIPTVLSIVAPTSAMAQSGTTLPPDPGPD
jgi:hypothetical protein